MSIASILVQIIISAVVVLIYHIWASGRKQTSAAPPVVNVTVNPPQVTVQPPQIVVNPAQVSVAPPQVVVNLPPPPAPAVLPALAHAAPAIVNHTTNTQESVAPEILAVIAAAIAVVIGKPHRVLAVQEGATRTPDLNVWALEGRVEHFMSHKVR